MEQKKKIMKVFILNGIAATLLFISCHSNNPNNTQQSQDRLSDTEDIYMDTVHTSQNSLDWQGSYEGTTPCADCPGIKTTVELKDDGTFTYRAEYLEREQAFTDSGTFMWHDNGSVVHLKGKDTDLKFKVGENQLIQLDIEGKQITSELAEYYVLKKK